MNYKKPGIVKKITHKLQEKAVIAQKNMLGKVDEKLIVFSSEPDFSDNSRILFEYMQNNGYSDRYKFVWIVKAPENFVNMAEKYKNTTFIAKNDEYMYLSKCALESLLSAHYYFGTHIRQQRVLKAGKGQTIVNLWHGCGFKDTQTMPWNDAFDYMLVPGDVFVDTKAKFFGCDKKMILPIGYPRYDCFFADSKNGMALAEKYRINEKTRIIIWMPTFRKTDKNKYPEEKIDYPYPLPVLRSDSDLAALDELCKEKNIILLVKKHQYQKDFDIDTDSLKNIIFIDDSTFIQNDVQMYEFLPFTDALISDYSSISIDYLLLDKPIGFTLDDYEKYKKTRGFVFDEPREYMPGKHIYDFDQLCRFFTDISEGLDECSAERAEVRRKTNKYNSDFCKRILDKFKI